MRTTLCKPLYTLLALGTAATPALADEQTVWRLFVADHGDAVLRTIDAETGSGLASFDLRAPATLYASESGRTVFAVQRDGNVVSAISSGISIGDHGDHGDLDVEDPKALELEIEGERPVHFVDHHGEIAIFFDGEGVARTFSEKPAHEGTAAIREISTSAPHHGVAIVWKDHVIVSEPDPTDPTKSPVGVKVLDALGIPGDLHACPGLHGEATSGSMMVIGCADGLLVVRNGAAGPQIEHLAYPSSLPEGAKVSTVAGGRGLQYFLGNFGPSAIVLVDPQDQDAFRLIELPTRRVHFAVDPVRAKFAYVFTEDGQLHQVNVLSGRITASLTLTEPYSMDGHWSDPRPRVAVTGDAIAVTDPLKGLVHMVDAETFTKAREFAVDGKPFSIVAVGGSGEAHD